MRAKDVVKSAERKDTYLFQAYLIEIGAGRTRGCDEEVGITVFDWPDNPDNAWSASWRMIARNI